jgi:hypothetical protein
MDWFVAVFEKLFPPMSALQTWRVMMAIFIMLLSVHALWAIGWIPGLDGFAQTHQIVSIQKEIEDNASEYKSSFNKIEQTQNTILARLIASDIETARGHQCKAIADRNTSGASGWRVRLDAALYEYRFAAGRDYPLRSCDEY